MATLALPAPTPATVRRQWQVIPFNREPEVIEPAAHPGVTQRHCRTAAKPSAAQPAPAKARPRAADPAASPAQTRARVQEAPRPKPVLVTAQAEAPLPRRMSREQGEALEKLAHAIEYLVDQGIVMSAESGTLDAHMGDMQAISLLKRHNRTLYLSLPVRVPFWKRVMGAVLMTQPQISFPM